MTDLAAIARLTAERQFSDEQRRWQVDPVAWAHERLGIDTYSVQEEILAAVAAHRRVAVQSCHGIGKSFSVAVLAAWWIDTHPPGTARVITTAPTGAQVRAILWQEIGALHARGDLPGRVNQTEWWVGRWMAGIGRKPADYSQSAFVGMHARFVLICLDEACGVGTPLWDGAESIATNDSSKIIAIGNPDDSTAAFARKCDSSNELWHTIQVGYERLPAFTGEQVPAALAEGLTSRQWVEERRAEWGEDNPLFVSKVLGRFPSDEPDKVVRPGDVARCRVGRDEMAPAGRLTPVELGLDVGGGIDETVIRERRGVQAGREWRRRTEDPETIAEMVVEAVTATGAKNVKYDAIGVGWSVGAICARALRDAGIRGVRMTPVNVAEAAKAPAKYKNRRAELWWEVGRLLSQDGGWDLSVMENADRTIAQLCDPKYAIDAAGRIVIESKDDIRRRTGRSPDSADALLLAFANYGGGPASMHTAEMVGARLDLPRQPRPRPSMGQGTPGRAGSYADRLRARGRIPGRP